MQRRKPLRRTKLIRRKPINRRTKTAQPRPKKRLGFTRGHQWKLAVCARAPRVEHKKVCPICREPPTSENPLQGHHVISQQKLRSHAKSVAHDARMTADELAELIERLLWDVRNGLPICERCHARHTKGVRRIPYGALRPCHFEFASELKLDWYLDRYYQHDDDSGRARPAGSIAPPG